LPTPRSLSLVLAGALASACTPKPTKVEFQTTAPTLLTVGAPNLRSPAIGLPFHGAAIVDLALLPPQTGEQWRLASGDTDGYVRIWADGKLLAVWHAHPGGLSDLQLATDGRWYTAGADGRVLEWRADALAPVRSLTLAKPPEPPPPPTTSERAKTNSDQPATPPPPPRSSKRSITALAVAGPHLAISDGRYVQLWTRDEQPQLAWSGAADAFVTGLALSPSGGVVVAAELRQRALWEGSATYTLAPFDDGPAAPTKEQQIELRAAADRDFPGAAADYVEVWQPSRDRSRVLEPQAPIDRDLGVLSRGGVVYREIYSPDQAGLIGRRFEDEATFPLELVKPWVFWTQANGQPTPASAAQGNPPAGDFRLGPAEEILILDLFPGWGSTPPDRGWRVGERRELAIDQHHAAIGDGQGNLAVVAWARPAETGWLAAGEQRIDLLAGARGQPQFVTATLEPRTEYRLWSLLTATQRSIRIEAPWHVLPAAGEQAAEQRAMDPAAGQPMYPSMLVVDAEPSLLVTSLSSFGLDGQAGVRVLNVADGSAQVLTLATSPAGLDVGVSPDGGFVLTWAPGAPAHSWQAPKDKQGWTPGPDAIPGEPRFSSNGRWSAHVSGFERTIVDLGARKPVVKVKAEGVGETLGADTLAAISDDGTLALVQPFGGGTLERIAIGREGAGDRTTIELPGAATALTWVPIADGPAVLLVGFADGTIARVDGSEVQPLHAGGGRIWELAALGGRSGIYVELDDRGLTVHRLADDATIELYLSDTTTLSRWDGSSVQAPHGDGLVAIWRPATATPPCRILDGTAAGVLADESIERWPRERAVELFEQFMSGASCMPAPQPTSEPESSGAPP
jgi:hypothetical protein